MCVEWKCLPLHRIKAVTMVSYEIRGFIERLNQDIENKEIRRRFHENYEWLESYLSNTRFLIRAKRLAFILALASDG